MHLRGVQCETNLPQVLSGAGGLIVLDRDGHHHGPLCRVARAVQSLTREHEFIEWYAEHLKQTTSWSVCAHMIGFRCRRPRPPSSATVPITSTILVEVLCP
ncbi:hypothetical protein HNQ07_004744 [Deinococcus metalli]|uniref:Uncharacterized protein n=1 Tax=Deinococcus metalli TaxID=1141878 RepID=A0A7W8KM99_9DEIO|nr:hypothetical protein [Deinococcus metalli]MBB5379229.1 hypothetical protein [Deinococcus metalli]GHF65567.1 hypothetical protein GCM10017781_46600 [Deinococcus metalli]